MIDGGKPRNLPSAHSHGFFTRDGVPPLELLRIGREQLLPYPSVKIVEGTALSISGTNGNFSVEFQHHSQETKETATTRKIILATGVSDVIPEIPGFKELWGNAVFMCPYCHGWEIQDKPIGIYSELPFSLDFVILLRSWSRDLVLFTNGPAKFDDKVRATLAALKVPLIETKISHLNFDGSTLKSIVLIDGSEVAREALQHAPPQIEASGLAEKLGLQKSPSGHVAVEMGKTSVAGIYAGGDLVHPAQVISLASAKGAEAAFFLNKELAVEDAERDAAAA